MGQADGNVMFAPAASTAPEYEPPQLNQDLTDGPPSPQSRRWMVAMDGITPEPPELELTQQWSQSQALTDANAAAQQQKSTSAASPTHSQEDDSTCRCCCTGACLTGVPVRY